jgi:hypothetical protein
MIAILKLQFSPLGGEELEKFIPIFEADGRLTDPEKIKNDLINKKNKFIEKAGENYLTSKITAYGGYLFNSTKTKFYQEHANEGELLKDLVKLTTDNFVNTCVWHNIDSMYEPKLYLSRIKYNLGAMFNLRNIFSVHNELSNRLRHLTIEDLAKYFGISSSEDGFWKEADLICKIYELIY